LVTGPTGATTACASLTGLVAAVWAITGPDVPSLSDSRASGPLSLPTSDRRRGVRLQVTANASASAPAMSLAEEWTVPTEAQALAAIGALAAPPWLSRRYLAEVSGVTAPWGGPPRRASGFDTAEQASDLVVRVEWARQAGAFDRNPFAASCPLNAVIRLDLEIRAGHMVRAVPVRI
jgi:hypothetical protein